MQVNLRSLTSKTRVFKIAFYLLEHLAADKKKTVIKLVSVSRFLSLQLFIHFNMCIIEKEWISAIIISKRSLIKELCMLIIMPSFYDEVSHVRASSFLRPKTKYLCNQYQLKKKGKVANVVMFRQKCNRISCASKTQRWWQNCFITF